MKNIIITGGSGGIGSFLVKYLLSENYFITVIGRSQDRFDKLGLNSENINFYSLDISSYQEIEEFFNVYSQKHHLLFALINTAGIQSPIGDFHKNNQQEWENNLKINILGTARMIKNALPLLKNGKYHKIINFSGGGATSVRPNFSAYAVSKIGIVKLTEILAYELKNHSIDINAVAPGAINTNMLDEIIDAGRDLSDKEYSQALERQKTGGDSPKKIIELCKFLLSDDSNGITGKLISAIWDNFQDEKFISRLKSDMEFCTLRRIDALNFDQIS